MGQFGIHLLDSGQYDAGQLKMGQFYTGQLDMDQLDTGKLETGQHVACHSLIQDNMVPVNLMEGTCLGHLDTGQLGWVNLA